MLDYRLYYWDLPFRGNFIQLLLEEVGAKYEKLDASEIYPEHRLNVHNPGMAPPYLYECQSEKYYAQMPAILMHLARKYDYLPEGEETQTLALKAILDCNDVLLEITNHHGMQMWEKEAWEDFRSARLARWMQIFEKTGRDHGLKSDTNFLLGSKICVADIAVTALFGTMVHSFPSLKVDLKENAPSILNLCQRIEAREGIESFLAKQRETLGQGYCGGEIEKSLREVIA